MSRPGVVRIKGGEVAAAKVRGLIAAKLAPSPPMPAPRDVEPIPVMRVVFGREVYLRHGATDGAEWYASLFRGAIWKRVDADAEARLEGAFTRWLGRPARKRKRS